MLKQLLSIAQQDGAIGGWVCFIISALLIITSFFTPPMWVIDSSVIAAVGELFAFGTLFKLPNIINSIRDGKTLTMKHGDNEITVAS